jgi:hypothetical protein
MVSSSLFEGVYVGQQTGTRRCAPLVKMDLIDSATRFRLMQKEVLAPPGECRIPIPSTLFELSLLL